MYSLVDENQSTPQQPQYANTGTTTVIVIQQESSTNASPKLLAILAVLFSWLGSLIVLLVEKQSVFAIAWAFQSLFASFFFIATAIILFIISAICGSNFDLQCIYNLLIINIIVYSIYAVLIVLEIILVLVTPEFVRLPLIGNWAWNRAVRRVQNNGYAVTGTCYPPLPGPTLNLNQ